MDDVGQLLPVVAGDFLNNMGITRRGVALPFHALNDCRLDISVDALSRSFRSSFNFVVQLDLHIKRDTLNIVGLVLVRSSVTAFVIVGHKLTPLSTLYIIAQRQLCVHIQNAQKYVYTFVHFTILKYVYAYAMLKAQQGDTPRKRKEVPTMSSIEIISKIESLKEWEALAAEAAAEIEALKDTIKKEMDGRGVEELEAGQYIARFTTVLTNRFDTTTFKKEHSEMYKQYTKQTTSRRFSIA